MSNSKDITPVNEALIFLLERARREIPGDNLPDTKLIDRLITDLSPEKEEVKTDSNPDK